MILITNVSNSTSKTDGTVPNSTANKQFNYSTNYQLENYTASCCIG